MTGSVKKSCMVSLKAVESLATGALKVEGYPIKPLHFDIFCSFQSKVSVPFKAEINANANADDLGVMLHPIGQKC